MTYQQEITNISGVDGEEIVRGGRVRDVAQTENMGACGTVCDGDVTQVTPR